MNTVTTNKRRNGRYIYDVAFSFAEEDREFVDRVAALLQDVETYYDDYRRIDTWGRDLYEYLEAVYQTEARFCVMFISKHYNVEGRWSRREREWAQERAKAFFDKQKDYILPFRLDSAEIPGLTDTMAYLSKETYSAEQLAQAIMDKVNRDKQRRLLLLTRMVSFFRSTSGRVVLGLMTGILILAGMVSRYPVSRQGLSANILSQPVKQEDSRPVPAVREWRFRALCRDGWVSQSDRQGRCSYHDGVLKPIDTAVYAESLDQARKKLMQAFQASK